MNPSCDNARRHQARPVTCPLKQTSVRVLWWTSWFPGFSAPRQYGLKYSRSAIEPATKLCRSFRARARARARARLPLRCEDDVNDGWLGRNAIVGHDDFDYEHEHR